MRSARSTKRLNTIIHQENSMPARIWRKSEFLQELNNEMQVLLPENLRQRCFIANISRSEVIIHIHTASLLTRLRQFQSVIITHINQHYEWAEIRKVSIRVRPAISQASARQKKIKRRKSPLIAETISEGARHCSDEGLKKALMALARHISEDCKET
ncbi:DciA family protein [Oceanospirillum sediminis]|uniref:DUF721 domain-containing protein n=1 Tax=Oceanospirillum sediminis TaxID=2760088 RepID=A0A839IL96_9GAMM|nr:DciA family protein [Oceanospirillum sediminis]MBB1485474.1 DUF721 domain-containing protein [Oceanospirillum sediminis]